MDRGWGRIKYLRVALTTLGCKVNQYESQLMRERIGTEEVDFVPFSCVADFYIINTCTVTEKSDRKSCFLIRKAKKINHFAVIIVTGCYVERNYEEIKEKFPDVLLLFNNQKKDIAKYVLGEKNVKQKDKEGIDCFSGHTRAFIKIQDGCDAFCSYCIVPYVRNKISSRNPYKIVEEVKRLVFNGHKEIVLVGIRLGKYQWAKTGLPGLIKIISKIADLKRIRLSSIEPQDINSEILEIMGNCSKLCAHLHLPLQSGDDCILKKMRRNYSLTQYEEIVEKIREKVPEIGITTDIITGFPGEKNENFEKGFEFIKKIAFYKLHVFKFSRREGTLAGQFKIEEKPKEVKERSSKLIQLSKTLQNNFVRKFKGKIRKVLIEKEKDGFFMGFTDNYIKIKVASKDGVETNSLLNCKIIGIEGEYAKGKFI